MLLAALGVFLGQIGWWLYAGEWLVPTLIDPLLFQGIAPVETGWVGIDRLILWIYEFSLAGLFFFGAFLVGWLAFVIEDVWQKMVFSPESDD